MAGEGGVVPSLPFPLVFSFLLVFSFSKREKSINKRIIILIQGERDYTAYIERPAIHKIAVRAIRIEHTIIPTIASPEAKYRVITTKKAGVSPALGGGWE